MSDTEVDRFWAVARDGARLASLPGYLPPTSLEMLAPPAWAFGSADGDALLQLVLGGTKTSTTSDPAAYEPDEPFPVAGALAIIVDSTGRPRVLIETTQVRVVAFDEVDPEHARQEGEGDLSLAHWREVHERFFRDCGHFEPEMDVIVERFRVVYQS